MQIKKLKLDLNPQILLQFLNSLVFVLFLFIFNASSATVFIVLFILWCWYLYNKFFSKRAELFFMFLSFMLSSFFVAVSIGDSGFNFVVFLFLGVLLYMFMESVSMSLSQFKSIFSIFYYILIFIISSFAVNFMMEYGSITILVMFLVYYLTLRNFISFTLEEKNKITSLWSLVISFVSVQFLWAPSFLSIGFLGIATEVIIFWVFSVDIMIKELSGFLTKKIVLRNAILFITFSFLALLLTTPF